MFQHDFKKVSRTQHVTLADWSIDDEAEPRLSASRSWDVLFVVALPIYICLLLVGAIRRRLPRR